MPNPTPRPSLTTTLVDRFSTQHTGGAFNSKDAGVVPTDDFNNEFSDGFTLRADNASNYDMPKKDSSFLQGFDNTKYKP